jgi:hypothetical protein
MKEMDEKLKEIERNRGEIERNRVEIGRKDIINFPRLPSTSFNFPHFLRLPSTSFDFSHFFHFFPFPMHTAVTNLAKATLDHTKNLIKAMDAE